MHAATTTNHDSMLLLRNSKWEKCHVLISHDRTEQVPFPVNRIDLAVGSTSPFAVLTMGVSIIKIKHIIQTKQSSSTLYSRAREYCIVQHSTLAIGTEQESTIREESTDRLSSIARNTNKPKHWLVLGVLRVVHWSRLTLNTHTHTQTQDRTLLSGTLLYYIHR